ncbi:MAG: class I SAM-dependent methyltransferase [Spirochaetes bacterium]|nr:class I SAM-dependent methyltransferase [Spirochaetota bacterium]
MKLNNIEFMLMNNPLRAFIQDKYELKILRNISSIGEIENALEIGCGNGTGTKLIKKYFSPDNIIAIDLDEKMVKIAQNRNKDNSITFRVMNASKLDFPDNHFDAVFDFGIIHHIPNWKDSIQELKRVLKPNGEIIIEELSIDTFSKGIGKIWRKILDHPYKDMYSNNEFKQYMAEAGFIIKNYKELNPLKMIRYFSLNAVGK